MTNLYLLRKRLPLLKNVGRVAGWLDFHILCGLIGPSLIVFHSNFKVGGLVAISFWSMMISAASGVVGRYFYTQLLQQRGSLKKDLKRYDEGFQKLHTMAPKIYTAAALAHAKHSAVRLAFGGHELKDVPPIAVPAETSRAVHRKFKQYGIMQRKLLLLDTYKRLMGYWHTFHVPFAVFMYVVAVIHIIAELLFRVT
jgi:cytochrome b561